MHAHQARRGTLNLAHSSQPSTRLLPWLEGGGGYEAARGTHAALFGVSLQVNMKRLEMSTLQQVLKSWYILWFQVGGRHPQG